MKKLILSVLCAGLSVTGTVAHAALVDRGNGLIYDTALNVTWLANANLAATQNFGVSGVSPLDGAMTWSTAQDWIAAMNTAGYLGYNNWRLPAAPQPDPACSSQTGGLSSGYGCTGSDLGELFYNELGGVQGQSIAVTHNASYSLFSNVASFETWTAGESASGTPGPWVFILSNGYLTTGDTVGSSYVWAVRTGDVAAVPVPAAVWLFGSGLMGLAGAGRRRHAPPAR